MKHKRFIDIERYKVSFDDGFKKGDHIVIQEKIDGANCAVRYDSEADTLVAQSRNNILNQNDDMRGFYDWVKLLDKNHVKAVLGNNLVLFGEWLAPHSVVYPEDKYNKAYFYDVYNLNTECYLPQTEVLKIVSELGLIYVPTFYDGEFTSWEDFAKYVGRTDLGGEIGEGIIVKNQTRLNAKNSSIPFYTKILSSKFSEVKKAAYRAIDDERAKELDRSRIAAETIVTKVRVQKMLYKFMDEGLISEDWGISEIPIIAKNMPKRIYDDCIKEEPQIVSQIDKFGKVANSISMNLVKQILDERDNLV